MQNKQPPPSPTPSEPVDGNQQPNTLRSSIVANGFNLSMLAIGMAAILALVYINTQEQIQTSVAAAKSKALLEVLPANWLDDSSLAYPIIMPNPQQLNQMQGSVVYLLKNKNQIKGWVIPTRTNEGYNGKIDVLVGVTTEGKITGVRVTQHQETPGLGDKIERKKSVWIDSFIGKNLNNTVWRVKKDGGNFDQFTGATITPRAVVNQVKQALEYYQVYQTALTDLAASDDQQAPLILVN